MFSDFRKAWRQAVDNFWRELEGEGDVSPSGYREVAAARNQLDRLDREIDECRSRLKAEREQLEVCLRRQRMAERIGDGETARVAGEYAARHSEVAAVLERKLEALEAERSLCRRDLGEMERALQNGARQRPEIRPELDDLNRHPFEDDFRDLEDSGRTRSAEERLEELKRRMNG